MVLNIDVVSDVICPWCFVAKRRLEQAIRDAGDRHHVRIGWHPLQLNPLMPSEGIARRIYRTAQLGCWDYSQSLDRRLIEVGQSVGIDFAFDWIDWVPNTFNAHRLIWLAQQEGLQAEMVDALFCNYFTQGENIGDLNVLRAIATTVGIHPTRFERWVETHEGSAAVKEEEAAAYRLGINRPPYIIINGKYSLAGAPDPRKIAAAFDQVNQLTLTHSG
jgi:predicted DsbA family dithiol-disulfide isomerase